MAAVMLLCVLGASRIVITEVMANPMGTSGSHGPEDRNEFIELYNPGPRSVDLYAWSINDGDNGDEIIAWQDTTILRGNHSLLINTTWLRPGGYAVVLDSEYTDPAPEGGFIRPYAFGDSTLILTTSNTTIGNGLAVTDPVWVTSRYGDTSTFGTPEDPFDSLPMDPGDGLSWERIRPEQADTVSNWIVCLDSSGSTPGRVNSICSWTDLSLTGLVLPEPPELEQGRQFVLRIEVANTGYTTVTDWHIDVFLDTDSDGQSDPEEPYVLVPGWTLTPGQDSGCSVTLSCPPTRTDLWVEIACRDDRNASNNRLRIALDPSGTGRLLSLATYSFSPDNDGIEDSLSVVFRLPEPRGRLNVAVFSLDGRAVRNLYEGRVDDDQGVLRWDGRGNRGEACPAGIYAVWLEYENSGATRTEKLPAALYR